jgi:hypothetical protein
MTNKLALAATLLVAGLAHDASASARWLDSPGQQNHSGACSGGTSAYIGYYGDPGVSPATGDVGYIHIVAISGCAYDTVGFDLFLPAGITTAVSAQNPVYCFRNNSPMPNDANGACAQTPSQGNYNGLLYGWTNLAPYQSFEIQIPVHYGTVAPSAIYAKMTSVISLLAPTITPAVVYRAGFASLSGSSSTDGTSANVVFELDSYYATGQLLVEYGVGAFDHATAPVSVPAAPNFPNANANLPGTTPGSTLSWRVKFITPYGTFYSPTRTVVLNKLTIQWNPPPVRCFPGRTC